MEVIIQSLGFKGSESLDSFIKGKINSIKDDKIVRANVVLYKGPGSSPENDYCEIRLEVPGNDHFVKKHSQYFETSVSECIDVLIQMIQKKKDKNEDRSQTQKTVLEESLSGNNNPDLEDVN